VAIPEGAELDADFVGPLREAAFKAGMPAPAFKAIADAFVQHQLDTRQAEATRQDGLTKALFSEWGDTKDAKLADAQRFVRHIGMSRQEISSFQAAVGSDRVLKLFAQLGGGMAEDMLIGGGKGKFGITAAEAQTELDRLNADPEHHAALAKKDQATINRRQRLIDAIAAEQDAKKRAS
jgi:hypothetical protein